MATPTTTKHRLFVWLDGATLADHGIIAFARDDDYTFGLLHSRVHELWARRMGTQLREYESGFRYTPTSTFETFAFPRPTSDQRRSIGDAAMELDRLRKGWLSPPGASEEELERRTLTNLYNERPSWLQNIHEALDRAVIDAYGWAYDDADDDLLDGLLQLNQQRAHVPA